MEESVKFGEGECISLKGHSSPWWIEGSSGYESLIFCNLQYNLQKGDQPPLYTGWGTSRFTVFSTQSTEFILVSLFIYYCVIFHMNNHKVTCAPPCTYCYLLGFSFFKTVKFNAWSSGFLGLHNQLFKGCW